MNRAIVFSKFLKNKSVLSLKCSRPILLRYCRVLLQGSALRSLKGEAGAIAQLVERLLCKQDVDGSNPSGSTMLRHSASSWLRMAQPFKNFYPPDYVGLAPRSPEGEVGPLAQLVRASC